MDEDQMFELEYHDEMELLAELENGKTVDQSFSRYSTQWLFLRRAVK